MVGPVPRTSSIHSAV